MRIIHHIPAYPYNKGNLEQRIAEYHKTTPAIYIAGLFEVPDMLRDHREINTLVSVTELSAEEQKELSALIQPNTQWNISNVDDWDERAAGHRPHDAPSHENLKSLAEFLIEWKHNQADSPNSLLVHCTQGKYRSTAVGLAAHALITGSPKTSATQLLAAQNDAVPNIEIIRCLDDLLNMKGELIEESKRLGIPDNLRALEAHLRPWGKDAKDYRNGAFAFPLIKREGVFSQIEQALSTPSTHNKLIFITGAKGSGKSALTHQLTTQLEKTHRCSTLYNVPDTGDVWPGLWREPATTLLDHRDPKTRRQLIHQHWPLLAQSKFNEFIGALARELSDDRRPWAVCAEINGGMNHHMKNLLHSVLNQSFDRVTLVVSGPPKLEVDLKRDVIQDYEASTHTIELNALTQNETHEVVRSGLTHIANIALIDADTLIRRVRNTIHLKQGPYPGRRSPQTEE